MKISRDKIGNAWSCDQYVCLILTLYICSVVSWVKSLMFHHIRCLLSLPVCHLQGFHRYSTDSSWHVPHFEKMLYDQAQLAVAYITAYQVRFRVCERVRFRCRCLCALVFVLDRASRRRRRVCFSFSPSNLSPH